MSPSSAFCLPASHCQRFASRILPQSLFPQPFQTATPARAQSFASRMPGAPSTEQLLPGSPSESSPRRRTSTSSWNVTWPSSEEVAYSFAKLSSANPEKGLKFEEFVHAAEKLQLNFTRAEMKRIFEEVDEDGDGFMLLSEFQNGAITSPFFRALVRAMSSPHDTFDIPNTFDYSHSTEHNYAVPLEDGFVGDFKDIRERMDYNFHQNYSHERQLWQDKLVRRCVLDGGFKTWEQPFLVHTCGPMGAGKGYVLGWLSAKGILPLEHIAKIDPDHFKLSMPEWPLYIARGQPSMAGTLTHKESGYIAEVAQEVALRNGTNVWVDGSLRDADWYSQRFVDLRERFPEYKIVILIISASEERLRRRLLHRSLQTGRYVPDHIAKASQRLFASLPKIIPLVDFVARIHNDDEPELQALEVVDKTGDWTKIAKFVM
eukprot:GEMP01022622.1.p1 GENE.GEMP01022622.1~~GEMP01022622.1.p1  ORF type:complete len:431 (+),score=81.30 GEMP01022622.1:120-1412(+)